MKKLAIALAAAFAASAGAAALVASAAAAQEPAAAPRELHPEAREAISLIRSPYCPGQMLEVCPSSGADALRQSIDEMAHSGLAADSIVELVVANHGEEYRALPQRSGGFGFLAWVIPPAVLLGGLVFVLIVMHRLNRVLPKPGARCPVTGATSATASDGAPALHDLTPEQLERLRDAMTEFDEAEDRQ